MFPSTALLSGADLLSSLNLTDYSPGDTDDSLSDEDDEESDDDDAEVERLRDTCPRVTYTQADDAFEERVRLLGERLGPIRILVGFAAGGVAGAG